MNLRFSTALLTALLATGCAPTQPQPFDAAQPWPEPDRSCASDSVLLDAYFDTGNLGRCTVNADGSFTLTLLPEDPPPINPSAWFAFRASGAPGETVAVRLEAESGYARYWPKTSIDGRNWTLYVRGERFYDDETTMRLDMLRGTGFPPREAARTISVEVYRLSGAGGPRDG